MVKVGFKLHIDYFGKWINPRAIPGNFVIVRFTGPLNESQISIIRTHTKQDRDLVSRWLDNREQRQKALVAFLRSQPTKSELARFIYEVLVRSHKIVDPNYRAISEGRWMRLEAMHFGVLKSINKEQRKKLILTLNEYASDIADLSGV